MGFSELVILVRRSGKRSSQRPTDSIVNIPLAVSLILAGGRFDASDGYAESMRLIQAAWREVGVTLCALLHGA